MTLHRRHPKRDASRSKYGVRTDAAGKQARTVDGILFASLREAKRYGELKLLEKAGHIRNVEVQPSYPLDAFGVECRPIGIYRADFSYWTRYTVSREGGPPIEHWRAVVEDVKGFKTPLYRWKKKHVEAQYGIEIREV